MTSIKGHFDGTGIVLDEPAVLEIGQAVRVIVEASHDGDGNGSGDGNGDAPRRSLRGIAKGMFEMRDDFNDPLDAFAEYRR